MREMMGIAQHARSRAINAIVATQNARDRLTDLARRKAPRRKLLAAACSFLAWEHEKEITQARLERWCTAITRRETMRAFRAAREENRLARGEYDIHGTWHPARRGQ